MLDLSADLVNKYTKVLAEIESKNKSSGDGSAIGCLIHGQRLTKEAFLDDGVSQLKQLEQYLKYDCDIDVEIPEY